MNLVALAHPAVFWTPCFWKTWVPRMFWKEKEQKKHANKFAFLLQLFQNSPLINKKRFMFCHLAETWQETKF